VDSFTLFSVLHVLTVSVCLLLIAIVAAVGLRWRATQSELRLRQSLAAATLLYWVSYTTWWNWGGWDLKGGLPLHICDINGMVATLALLTGNRWLRAVLYFWTFALTTQAFIQPHLNVGPAHILFWAFWGAHSLILACAVYDVVVLKFRPDWSDLGRACAASAAYIALVMPIDLVLGANYGFVGNPADPKMIPPFVAALGPWPWRVLVIFALAALGFVLVLLPWLAVRRTRRGALPT
jgi:hypothetical integral membrane protein (TIGR02206 family)